MCFRWQVGEEERHMEGNLGSCPHFSIPWTEVTLLQLIVIYEELLMDQNLKQKQSGIDTWEVSAHASYCSQKYSVILPSHLFCLKTLNLTFVFGPDYLGKACVLFSKSSSGHQGIRCSNTALANSVIYGEPIRPFTTVSNTAASREIMLRGVPKCHHYFPECGMFDAVRWNLEVNNGNVKVTILPELSRLLSDQMTVSNEEMPSSLTITDLAIW